MKSDRIRTIGAVFAMGLVTPFAASAQTEAMPTAAPAETQPEISDEDALRAMGFLVGQQFRLNIGFSDEEFNTIVEGLRMAANDEQPPENFREALPRAQEIYMKRMAAFQEKEDAIRKEQADKNKAEAQAYVAELEARGVQKSESGLYYEILAPGDPEKKPGPRDRAKLHYKGSLTDGTVFDQSPEGEAVTFSVGGMIPGFSEGMQLVGEGGKVRLYIPSELGYGDTPPPTSGIEAGDMLVFDLEMVEVLPTPSVRTPPGMPGAPGAPGGRPPGPPPNMPPPSGPPPGPPPSSPPPGPPPSMKDLPKAPPTSK